MKDSKDVLERAVIAKERYDRKQKDLNEAKDAVNLISHELEKIAVLADSGPTVYLIFGDMYVLRKNVNGRADLLKATVVDVS